MSHHAHTIHSLDEHIEYQTHYMSRGVVKMLEGKERDDAIRYAKRVWKQHIAKNGNVPMIIKCAVCSGKEFKSDIKHGRYQKRRPSKILRDEMRGE